MPYASSCPLTLDDNRRSGSALTICFRDDYDDYYDYDDDDLLGLASERFLSLFFFFVVIDLATAALSPGCFDAAAVVSSCPPICSFRDGDDFFGVASPERLLLSLVIFFIVLDFAPVVPSPDFLAGAVLSTNFRGRPISIRLWCELLQSRDRGLLRSVASS
jgi:hypothetical protein